MAHLIRKCSESCHSTNGRARRGASGQPGPVSLLPSYHCRPPPRFRPARSLSARAYALGASAVARRAYFHMIEQQPFFFFGSLSSAAPAEPPSVTCCAFPGLLSWGTFSLRTSTTALFLAPLLSSPPPPSTAEDPPFCAPCPLAFVGEACPLLACRSCSSARAVSVAASGCSVSGVPSGFFSLPCLQRRSSSSASWLI